MPFIFQSIFTNVFLSLIRFFFHILFTDGKKRKVQKTFLEDLYIFPTIVFRKFFCDLANFLWFCQTMKDSGLTEKEKRQIYSITETLSEKLSLWNNLTKALIVSNFRVTLHDVKLFRRHSLPAVLEFTIKTFFCRSSSELNSKERPQ